MLDKNGKEISVGDVVTWPYVISWRGPRPPHKGIVVCCLYAKEPMPENILAFIRAKDYKTAGSLMIVSATDRVIVEVGRPKSCPMLYTPLPSAVEVTCQK
jgi:hypothetical protein